MNVRNHPHMIKLYSRYKEPLTKLYMAVLVTYIALGLTFGWF